MLHFFLYVITNGIMITFFMGGISYLVINLFYALIITILIYSLPKYDMVITIAGSFLFMLNPLRIIQEKLRLKFNEKPFSLKDLAISSNNIFYAYRSDMKKYFHHDAKCKYNKGGFYFFLRNITSSILFGGGVFLSFLKIVSYENFISLKIYEAIFYLFAVIFLFISSVLVARKSFFSGFRFIYSILPLLLTYYISFYIPFKGELTKIITISFLGLIAFLILIISFSLYLRRVVYFSYNYFGANDNKQTSANALYEPYIFESGASLVAIYSFPIGGSFNKRLRKLFIRANIKRFIITGYKIKDGYLTLYTAFSDKSYSKARSFMNYISTIFETKDVSLNTIVDKAHLIYPKAFSNDENYIITRAKTTAQLLWELNYKKAFLLSFFFYFENYGDIIRFKDVIKDKIYDSKEIDNLLNVDVLTKNDSLKVEFYIRLLLANTQKYGGNYLKLAIKYQDDKLIIL